MPPERFDELVALALDDIPPELTDVMDNVVVLVEDEPPEDEPDLLGLYDGVALTERWGDPMMQLPDRIFIFRGPLLDMCESEEEPPPDEPDLLGWYEGTPLTERDWSYGGVLPDRIVVFRGPTLRMCDTEDDVVDEVHITVVHEIAHHFGIDDDRLHELGYD